MFRWAHQLGLALDQLLNVVFYSSYDKEQYGYGWGWADETLCARAYRLHTHSTVWNMMRATFDFLFFWDKGVHCYNAYMNEFKKHQLPPHYADTLERYEIDVMNWDFGGHDD